MRTGASPGLVGHGGGTLEASREHQHMQMSIFSHDEDSRLF